MQERKITVSIKSSLNLPSPREIQLDIMQLNNARISRIDYIELLKQSIASHKQEQKELLELAKNPGDYDAEACKEAARRKEQHIDSIMALIRKEQAGVDQLDHMIRVCEKRKWVSEQISRLNGKEAHG